MKRIPLLICLLASLAAAQNPRQANPQGPMSDAGPANLPGQKIGANDLLAISVYDAPELTRTVRVAAEGYIRLPMVGEKIKAQGLLPSELESAISEILVKEGILVKPVVMVTVAEYSSRPVSVVGAVKRPLTFQAVGRITVLDALARAEGLSDLAGPEILVTSYTTEEGAEKRLVQRFLVRDLIDNAKPEMNLLLQGGEEIRVPEARKIFVAGNVKKPGAFPVKEDSQMTVLRALALSEGLSPFPQKYAYVYRTADKQGGKAEIQVELAKIMKREAVDFRLEPEDTLYIPEDSGRKTLVTTAEKVVAFGLATASGVLIWKR
ncbi:MAG: polysaccharide biosynthesis/export family protein [Acidobacteria bacterium]|nr:polysaccharide biosynthesis/export family protein [Acidobacteriota bacterium]